MERHERDLDLIASILEDADELKGRIAYFETTQQSFVEDRSQKGRIAYDSIMSPVYRIAEDALHLSDDIMASCPDYPWDDIKGFRNFVAHGYRDVDRVIAWGVAVKDIPELAETLRQYLGRNDSDSHEIG